MTKFDGDHNKCLDREEFRKVLKELDPHHHEALPLDFNWAWDMADKNHDGCVSLIELSQLFAPVL